MELKLDLDKFDEYQKLFIKEMVQTIMVKIVEAGVEGQQLEDATAGVAFSVASLIDDTTQIESDGAIVKPFLTFREDDDKLVHCGENSYTYDQVMGVMKQLFPH